MSKTKVKISKLAYNGQFHFKVDVPTTSATRIKAVSSRNFSRTLRCWHFPNTLDILDGLQLHFEVRVRAIDLCAIFDRLKKVRIGSVTIRGLRQWFANYLPIRCLYFSYLFSLTIHYY